MAKPETAPPYREINYKKNTVYLKLPPPLLDCPPYSVWLKSPWDACWFPKIATIDGLTKSTGKSRGPEICR